MGASTYFRASTGIIIRVVLHQRAGNDEMRKLGGRQSHIDSCMALELYGLKAETTLAFLHGNPKMLILTGTSGHLGSRALSSLLEHKLLPPSELIISTSAPEKVSATAREHNIRVEEASYEDEASLQRLFAIPGADTLFLVSYPSPSLDRWLHHKRVIDAANAPGSNVKTVIYTSLMFGGETGMESVAGVQQAHIRTVDYLREHSKLDYVIIREGLYAESWWLYAGFQPMQISKGSEDLDFVVPADGPTAWVSWDDLGEGTARILADYRKYMGKTLNLTGSYTSTIADIASLVEKNTGRKVNLKIVGPEEAKRYHLERKSVPEEASWQVESWSNWHEGIKAGETAIVDPLLEKLIGRKPKGMKECAKDLFHPV